MLSIGSMSLKRDGVKRNRVWTVLRKRNNLQRKGIIVCVIFVVNGVNNYEVWYYEEVKKGEFGGSWYGIGI